MSVWIDRGMVGDCECGPSERDKAMWHGNHGWPCPKKKKVRNVEVSIPIAPPVVPSFPPPLVPSFPKPFVPPFTTPAPLKPTVDHLAFHDDIGVKVKDASPDVSPKKIPWYKRFFSWLFGWFK
jgi:hypothetical protein